MKKWFAFGRLLPLICALLLMSCASVFAAAGTDWESSVIEVEGTGVAPANARNAVQARMMARRAAVVDAYRQIAEQIAGVQVDAATTVEDMAVSSDAPALDIAYKLVKYDGRPVLKLSSGKKTLVEEKQVFRSRRNGAWAGDTIALGREHLEGEPLLELAMNAGIRAEPRRSLSEIRERFAAEFAELPQAHKALKDPEPYPVGLSEELERLQSETVQAVIGKELGES